MNETEPSKSTRRNNMKWIAILGTLLILIVLSHSAQWASKTTGVTASQPPQEASWEPDGAEPRPRRVVVTRAELGPNWPLTVGHGEVFCEPPGLVGFTAPDGRSYALNGTAGARYQPIAPIWARDRRASRLAGEDMRVSLGHLIATGLELCEK